MSKQLHMTHVHSDVPAVERFPSTRYQGSKVRHLRWIRSHLEGISFGSALDAFGGTGAVSYLFKAMGKRTIYNDHLKANFLTGKALVENKDVRLEARRLVEVFRPLPGRNYDDFIARTFKDIFFTDDENRQLDVAGRNLQYLGGYEATLAYHAIFQACIAKRPYNLFHRANLYMRLADVDRSFGNKATWDKSFEEHSIAAVNEANAAVFDNGMENVAVCVDALDAPADVDLVYLDPPYMSDKGVGVDYLDFYHFIEGLADYDTWPSVVDHKYKHRPLRRRETPWCDKERISQQFDRVLDRFKDSIIVLSYRSDGIPSVSELIKLVKRHKRRVREPVFANQKYVLSNKQSMELLLVAE